MYNSLTMKEKIGQRFILGINDTNIQDIIYLIREYAIGGVILYKKNYKNYHDMLSVIKQLKEANFNNKVPLFIAIDQEGGVVNRLPSEFVNLKNMEDLSKTDESLVYESAKVIGNILKDAGINMNLAPVMDIRNNSKSKVLYKRCFFGDIEFISKCGIRYIEAMKEENVLAVSKHYPGHGISKLDSHFLVPYVFNYNNVLNKHMLPFNNIMRMKADALMIGHIVIRKMTGLLPSSISSKFITKYVRNNYNGILITDEVKMLNRNVFYRYIYLNKALSSGEDIVLIKIKNRTEGIKIMEKAYKILYDDKKNDESVKRIIDVKKRYNVSDDINFNGVDINEINDRIIKINGKVN